jgi:hypothetical protein
MVFIAYMYWLVTTEYDMVHNFDSAKGKIEDSIWSGKY